MKNILVLCTGNVCRSPMAEFWLQKELGPESYRVESAGLGAVIDSAPEDLAQKVSLAHGLDISSHRGRQVTIDMLRWADLVLVMEKRQQQCLLERYPWLNGKIFRFGEPLKVDVPDPHGRPESAFALVWNFIEKLTPYWVEKLHS